VDSEIEEEALRKDAVRFIQKPASIKEIVGAVERVASCKGSTVTVASDKASEG
jgi:FixJ family two-component response regulator